VPFFLQAPANREQCKNTRKNDYTFSYWRRIMVDFLGEKETKWKEKKERFKI